MIPLAQYFASNGGEDFTPMAAAPARKPVQRPLAPLQRQAAAPTRPAAAQQARPTAGAKAPPLRDTEGVTLLTSGATSLARPAKIPVQSARQIETVSPRVMTEPRIALRVVEAERAAWAAERVAQAEALADAVAEARAEGIELGRRLGAESVEATLDERLDAAKGELEAAHAADLSASRQAWTQDQGDRLADLMVLQMAILEESIKVSLSSVLRPLALDARRRQTLEELVGAVKTMALDGAAYKIAATGPEDLLADLKGKLGDHAKLLSFQADETQPDIRIDADNTVIESRLSSWRQALDEALS